MTHFLAIVLTQKQLHFCYTAHFCDCFCTERYIVNCAAVQFVMGKMKIVYFHVPTMSE